MRRFVVLLAAWLVLSTTMVTVLSWNSRVSRAVLGMGWRLILLWIGAGGLLMHGFRDRVRAWRQSWSRGWPIKFVLGCTALALVEEAVTTTMTNLAPWFGVRVGEAYITASADYLDVVLCHSVVVFVPMFIGWAWLLHRFGFTAAEAFVLFGLTGTLAECTFGWQHLFEFGLWIFVYGLMVYLPAFATAPARAPQPRRWWHYPLAVVVPFAFLILVPTPLLVQWFCPGHPQIHFPPIAK
jgi:hypothetical protein